MRKKRYAGLVKKSLMLVTGAAAAAAAATGKRARRAAFGHGNERQNQQRFLGRSPFEARVGSVYSDLGICQPDRGRLRRTTGLDRTTNGRTNALRLGTRWLPTTTSKGTAEKHVSRS